MAYLVAVGHGVALVSLVAMVPQPTTDAPAQPVQRNESASGDIHEIGLWAPLQWNVIRPVTLYAALLDQFGLGAALTASVTVYIPNHEYVFTRYNATAVRPEQGKTVKRTNYMVRDVTIILKKLTSI